MSYLIQGPSLSYAVQEQMRRDAVVSGRKALFDKKIVTASDPDLVVDRDADYVADFVPPATAAGLGGWLTMPLAAAGANYSVFANNVPAALVPQVANNTVVVFYGVHILTPGDPVSLLTFATGRNGNITKAYFDLEKLYSNTETWGYFTKPVVYYPQEFITCTVRARAATGVGCRVMLDTLIFEPIQTTQA